jgi:hypothetical protein
MIEAGEDLPLLAEALHERLATAHELDRNALREIAAFADR